jgi:tetratricopeptide (TPR) repeat protein
MSHRWVTLSRPVTPDELPSLLPADLPKPLLEPVAAHRNLRGPYTAAGWLVRALVPEAQRRWPDLVDRHQIELLSVAPQLREVVPASRETLTSLAVPKERTRFYSRLRTQRISHGLVEFVQEYLRRTGAQPRSLVVHGIEGIEHTDAEFLAILLRRTEPDLLTVVVCGAGPEVAPPLAEALESYAAASAVAAGSPRSAGDDRAAAARYVASDCALDWPELVEAYQRIPAAERQALHDRRADELDGTDAPLLGAVPLHRERGSDLAGAGVDALRAGLDHCVDMGFYHATVDFGHRGRAALREPGDRLNDWWQFTTKMTISLAALGRPAEAEALYQDTLARSDSPSVHMQAAYAVAMLYTRHNQEPQRDHVRAKGLLNQAVAFAKLLFDGKERAFRVVFNRNGLALAEAHLGNLPEALRLVDEGIELLDAELDADEHRLHRSVLLHNRSQVLTGLGRLSEALDGYDAVIALDPNYPDYHLDRGNVLHRLGRDEEALAAYETAIRLGPPFPEAQYNKAELLHDAGEIDAALATLDYVLVLDPDMVDAYVNRAGIHLDRDDLDQAERDATAGLTRDPDNAHLLAVLGQVRADRDDHQGARTALDHALRVSPDLLPALVARASVAHELGDTPGALADLDHAVELSPDDPAVRYNRAYLYTQSGRRDEARTDLNHAAKLAPDDEDIAEALRDLDGTAIVH